MKKNKIFFRADGHAQMGLGHVFRSLALVQMLKDHFECHFIIRTPLPILEKQILKVCHSMIKIDDLKSHEEEIKEICTTLQSGDIIVLDGYHFKTNYQQALKNKGLIVLCIDDIKAYHFVADGIINHAPGLLPEVYSKESYTKTFLGLEYSLLRPPFLAAAKMDRQITSLNNVFVCFGGADHTNISLKCLQYLSSIPELIKEVNVVLGGANSYKITIEKFAKKEKRIYINTHQNLSATQMVHLMQASDLAIVPASSILYEVASVGMPVISGYYVDNQVNVYKGFHQLGLIEGIGNFNTFSNYKEKIEILSPLNFNDIIKRQRQYLRGNSKNNFINLFNSLK